MIRLLLVVVFILAGASLQGSLAQWSGHTIDLVLMLTVAVTLVCGVGVGSATGFAGGALLGAVGGGVSPPLAAAYVASACTAGLLAGTDDATGLRATFAITAASTGVLFATEALLLSALGVPNSINLPLAAPLAVLQGVAEIPLLALMRAALWEPFPPPTPGGRQSA